MNKKTKVGWIDDVPYETVIDEVSDALWDVMLRLLGVVDMFNSKQLTVEQQLQLYEDPETFKASINAGVNMSLAIDALINARNSYEALDQLIIKKNVLQLVQEEESNEL